MRIEKFVEFSQEIEIELTSEDIRLILEESETLRGLLSNISIIMRFLKVIPDKLIKELSSEHKKIILTAFQETMDKISEY